MERLEGKVKCVTVKRKACDQPLITPKRCKLITSLSTVDNVSVSLALKNRCDIISDVEIIDFDCLPDGSQLKSLFRICNEPITCNGKELVKVDTSKEEYVYDVFLCENKLEYEDDFEDENDEEVSSSDENHPYNDYPDEDEYDYEEYDYYREWEDDESIQLRKSLQCSRISDDYDANEDSDNS